MTAAEPDEARLELASAFVPTGLARELVSEHSCLPHHSSQLLWSETVAAWRSMEVIDRPGRDVAGIPKRRPVSPRSRVSERWRQMPLRLLLPPCPQTTIWTGPRSSGISPHKAAALRWLRKAPRSSAAYANTAAIQYPDRFRPAWPTAYTPRWIGCSKPGRTRPKIAFLLKPAWCSCATDTTPCCRAATSAAARSGLARLLPMRQQRRQGQLSRPRGLAFVTSLRVGCAGRRCARRRSRGRVAARGRCAARAGLSPRRRRARFPTHARRRRLPGPGSAGRSRR